MGIMHVKFQLSSFNGVGGEGGEGGGGDRRRDGQGTSSHISNFPPRFMLDYCKKKQSSLD